jgi:hypothetical protein
MYAITLWRMFCVALVSAGMMFVWDLHMGTTSHGLAPLSLVTWLLMLVPIGFVGGFVFPGRAWLAGLAACVFAVAILRTWIHPIPWAPTLVALEVSIAAVVGLVTGRIAGRVRKGQW